MNTNDFLRTATYNGYATAPTTRDYMELHDEPYTDADLQAVYRLQAYRDDRDVKRAAQGEMIQVEAWR